MVLPDPPILLMSATTRPAGGRRRATRLRFWGVVWLTLLGAVASAQTSRVGGTLEGTIKDSTRAAVPEAEVRLRNTETNQTRSVASDAKGYFRLNELPVGVYEVQVQHPGFTMYRHAGVIVQVGQTVRLDVELALAGVTAEVTVTDQPPAMDPRQTMLTTTVELERIMESPVRDRNFLNFVLLAPGVASSTQTRLPLGDSGFTFGGLRTRSNNVSIDGLDNNDEFTGSSRTELSLELVREFQVVNNGLSAESGGASGGAINVVTRTGSNAFHGGGFLLLQTAPMNAKEPFTFKTREKPDLARYRLGLALGGPIVKDRTFFYAALEQEHTLSDDNPFIDPQAVTAINNFLDGEGYPRLPTRIVTNSLYTTAQEETEFSLKLNHQIDASNSLMLRYAFNNNRLPGLGFNTTALFDSSARGSSFTKDHAGVGSLVSLLGPGVVNDLRLQWATRQVVQRTDQHLGPEIDISGVATFGRPYEGNGTRKEDHYQLTDSLAIGRGAHSFKLGGSVNHVRLGSSLADGFGGVYVFSSLDNFLNSRPDSYRQAFGSQDTHFSVTSFGGFAQDHWSLSKLTFDMGLRYDFEKLPAGFHQDTDNFSPRFGVAYHPFNRWVFRGGYGIFYDRYTLAPLNRIVQKDGSQAFEQVFGPDAAEALVRQTRGAPLSQPQNGVSPSIYRADPSLEAAYSQQANVGFEYLVNPDITASANYLFVRGVHLSRTRNVNLTPPVVLTPSNAAALGFLNPSAQQLGRLVFGLDRLDPRFNDIYQYESSASSRYHGVSLALRRRFMNEFAFLASYTASRATDDASDFDEQPQDPYDLKAEQSLSRNHQGHRLVLSALFDVFEDENKGKQVESKRRTLGQKLWAQLLGRLEFAPILTFTSGRPIPVLTGEDSNHSQAYPLTSRPLGSGRNALLGPKGFVVDLRAVKYFDTGGRGKLDLEVDIFNLFNHFNVDQLNNVYGTGLDPVSSFRNRVGAQNARQIQFTLDFEF